jgi:hypothetical protein
MPWAKFDDRFPSNRKVRLLSDRAFRLYVSGICWSAENLTDGFIAETELRLVADIRGAKAAATELVNAGLWVPSMRVRAAVASSSRRVGVANASSSRRGRVEVGDAPDDTKVRGWEIHDYHEYNPTAEQVRADRDAKSARQQRWREKRKGGDGDTGQVPPRSDVDASPDASRDASRNGAGDAAPRARIPDPTRPVPLSLSAPSDPTSTTPVPEATNERETEPPNSTDRTATLAQQTVRAANVVTTEQEPEFIDWLKAKHQIRGPGWWKTVTTVDLAEHATDWRNHRTTRASPATAPLPPWCGQCGDGIPLARTNADLRKTEDARGIRRPCPDCHPAAHRKAS